MKTICLNMIVKNESHIIRRCLEAVKNHIDYWVIVDTGSTDGTQDLIRECLSDCPGELHEKPWQDFEHNRNEALDPASGKGDYVLFVDADEVIHFTSRFDKSKLLKGYYLVKTKAPSIEFYVAKLIQNEPDWRWTNVLHEFIQHFGDVDGDYLPEIWTESMQDGASMSGNHDETFWAMFCVGQLQEELEMAPEVYLKSYDRAYQFDTSRAEPLERIANYYFQNDCPSITYSVIKHAHSLPAPKPLTSGYYDWVYDFAVHSVYADCAFALGKIDEAKELYLKILDKQTGPKGLRAHTERQLKKIDSLVRKKERAFV